MRATLWSGFPAWALPASPPTPGGPPLRGDRVERGGLDDPARRPRTGGPAGVGGGAARRRGLTRRPRGGRDAPLRRHRGPGRPALATLLPAPSARGSLVRLDRRARRLAWAPVRAAPARGDGACRDRRSARDAVPRSRVSLARSGDRRGAAPTLRHACLRCRGEPGPRGVADERRRERGAPRHRRRLEEHTSELQSPDHLVCRLLLEKKKKKVDE